MKTKKCISILLCLALAVSLLAACGSAPQTPAAEGPVSAVEAPVQENAEPEPAAETAEAESSEEIVESAVEPEEAVDEELEAAKEATLSYFPADPDTPAVTVAIKWFDMLYDMILGSDPTAVGWYQWLTEQTGMDLEYKVYGTNSMATTVPLDIASGDLPEILTFDLSEYYPAGMSAAVDEDIILDLAPNYKEYMPFYYELLNSKLDYLTTAYTTEGYLPYAVGVIDENIGTDGGWIIRRDWLEEAGLETPVTFEDWHDALAAFKEHGHPNALWLPYHGAAANEGLSAGYGISSNLTHGDVPIYFDAQDDMKVKFGPLEDAYFDYLQMLSQWYQEDLIFRDFYSATEEDFPDSTLHTQERLGVFTGTVGELASTVNYYDEGSTYDPIGISAPRLHAGDTLYLGRQKASGASTRGAWSITGNCPQEQLETAMRMIDLFYTEEGTKFANYGLEGVTYTEDADGKIAYTEFVTNNPLGLPFDPIIACYGFTDGPYYQTPLRTQICYNDMQQEAMAIWSDNEAPFVNLTMDQETVYEINSLKTDLATYLVEHQVKFIIGDIPVTEDAFETFRQELRDMGADRLIELYETAYEADAENRAKIEALFEG